MKRILASVLALSMMLGLVNGVFAESEAASEELPSNVAKIVFDKGGHTATDNITRVGYVGTPELIDGQYALKRDHTIEDGRHIQVVTSNDWLYAPNGTSVEIEVEYYDISNGFFLLRYNGLNDKLWWEGFTDKWSETEKLTMTNSGEWKKHTFYIDENCGHILTQV